MPTTTDIHIREAQTTDHEFILGLSPTLAEVANLPWHSDETILKFQDAYIAEMLAQTDKHITLIAEKNKEPIGFVHAC